MGLKERLEQKAQSQKLADISYSDLPSGFKNRLDDFNRTNRLKTLFDGVVHTHYVQISTAPGQNSAYLSLYLRGDEHLDKTRISMLLSQVGIVHGVNLDALDPQMENGTFAKTFIGVEIAKGTPIELGKPGGIELFKRPYNSSSPQDLESFDEVAEEEEIAVVNPPLRGNPGMNILGEELPCPQLRTVDFRLNPNIKKLNTGDRISLVALTGGYLSKYNDEIAVNKELIISGDVTVHRGSLVYGYDVIVNGNICEKTNMSVGGNMRVKGLVSQSQIQVSGELEIDKGIFGKGDCKVHVQGNIHCVYMNETHLDCEGYIHIEKEILNSHTWTQKALNSPHAVIVGGDHFAQDRMEVASIGSDLGLKTLIVVGTDKREYEIDNRLLPEIENLKERLVRAKEMLSGANSNNREFIQKNVEELSNEIASREAEIEYNRSNMKERNPDASLIIKDAIHPGTIIVIGDAEKRVGENIMGPCILKADGQEIVIHKGTKD
jgi:uncharacterized protein (DUF342 family)